MDIVFPVAIDFNREADGRGCARIRFRTVAVTVVAIRTHPGPRRSRVENACSWVREGDSESCAARAAPKLKHSDCDVDICELRSIDI